MAARSGVEGFTPQLTHDFGPQIIRINAVVPTVIMTGECTKGFRQAKSESERDKVVANITLRRLSELRAVVAVAFLASDESSYIIFITLDVVGSRYLR